MKLHLTTAPNNYLITGYGIDENMQFVEVNGQRYTASLIVTPDQLQLSWAAINFADLTQGHFTKIMDLKPEVVLLGTGQVHQFLHPSITQVLTNNGVAIECMTTAAACRTYNILMSEGRSVVAALLV